MPDEYDCMRYPRLDLTPDERTLLRSVWRAPDVRPIIEKIRAKMTERVYEQLMVCPVDKVDYVRNQKDALDLVFGIITQTGKSDAEVAKERKNAHGTDSQVCKTI